MSTIHFYINGGSAGGQSLEVYFDLEINGSQADGPHIAIPKPPANGWIDVQLSLASLNPNNATVTGITWLDSSGNSQPTFYLDDITLESPSSSNGPSLTVDSLTPGSLKADNATSMVIRVKASDPQGLGDIASVTLDARSIGRGIVILYDDGKSNDGQANDGMYGAVIYLPVGLSAGEIRLLITATDKTNNQYSILTGSLNVLAPPGGSILAALPQKIGYGTNAWSSTAGQDWQQNSGVPWNYVYQIFNWGWESVDANGQYVARFVQQAWGKNYTPLVTMYMMVGLPTTCWESGSCYFQKLQNAGTVQSYLDSLTRAAQQVAGAKPVIVNLEPDFLGFMQQLSNLSTRPAGVQPNDPNSIPVALNKSGYANTLAGFGKYMVDLVHSKAANALVAPVASTWATKAEMQYSSTSQATQMAQTTANFINACGGSQADLLIVDWRNRDAGSGEDPWWDDTDHTTPRPTRAIRWENALSIATGKRLVLWQVPVGNMSQNNTLNHYKDNRSAYVFSYPRDLFDAGVFAVMFGGGNSNMTQVTTDGGYVSSQGATAYASPATPSGFTLTGSTSIYALLRWNENPELDIWYYRLYYRENPGGTWKWLDVGRKNAYALRMPHKGSWEIYLIAVDAMGYNSTQTGSVFVTTTADPNAAYLPLIQK